MVPGHECIGDIVAIGEGERVWRIGDRAGGGWHGGHDSNISSNSGIRREDSPDQWQIPANLANVGFSRSAKTRLSMV